MTPWGVELTPAAARQLGRVRADELLALRGVILALADDQRPPGARKLSGTDLWRLRLRIDGAPWRIVYQLRSRDQLVIVTRVARRDEATSVGSAPVGSYAVMAGIRRESASAAAGSERRRA